MNKKLAVLLVVLMMGLTACSGQKEAAGTKTETIQEEKPGTTESGKEVSQESSKGENDIIDLSGKEITVILKNMTSPTCIRMNDSLMKAQEDFGCKINVLAPVGTEGTGSEEQAQMVEQSLVQNVDAVVIMPIDSQGIVPAVKKLVDADIPVINLNTKIGGDEMLAKTFVAIENYDVGFRVADELAKAIDGSGKVFIIEGTPGAQTSIDRTSGAHDAFFGYEGIEVVADQAANYNRAEAMNVVQNLLQAYPDVNAIFCCNDEMAMGAIEAIDAAGKAGTILVGGVDANSDAVESVKEGKYYVTCDAMPEDQAYQSIVAAADVLSGEAVDEFIKIDAKLITKENAE